MHELELAHVLTYSTVFGGGTPRIVEEDSETARTTELKEGLAVSPWCPKALKRKAHKIIQRLLLLALEE